MWTRQRFAFPSPADVDVSRAASSQAEVRIAADPRNPAILLAASNSEEDAIRVYDSTDAGLSWSSAPLRDFPPGEAAPCVSDPATAIDDQGNQFVAYIESTQACSAGGDGDVTI